MKSLNIVKCSAVVIAALVLTTSTSKAFTLVWSASGFDVATGLTLSDQTTGLSIGSLVAVGNFGSMTDLDIAALGPNPSSVWANFQPWATGAIGDGTFAEGSFTISSIAPGSGYFSEQIYLVAFNSSSAGTATQVGVFKGPSSSPSFGDSWTFPPDDLSAKSIVTDALNASHVIIGSYGVETYNNVDWWGENVNALALAAIPEPSTYALVGAAVLGLLAVRRRK
jgi:hypothetical protein